MIDTDAIFGFYIKTDSHHNASQLIHTKLHQENADLFITNLVLYETATVLSHKTTQQQAVAVMKTLLNTNYTLIFIDELLTEKTFDVFFSQTKKGTSFVDCANMIVAQEFKLDKIFSFDEFYPAKLRF
ncbi:MAG TPA: hypothetical protein VJH96_00155 [Patescibacteria group bacterium]|nr:hypothetical protein [Patescibacteria group bacterium]